MTSDIVDLIRMDHKAVEELFAKVRTCHSRPDKLHLADKIAMELMKHMAAEENVVYPHLPFEMRQHAKEEHCDAREFIDRIITGVGDLDTTLESLHEAIVHHVEEEETDMIPWLCNNREHLDLDSMGVKFEEFKKGV